MLLLLGLFDIDQILLPDSIILYLLLKVLLQELLFFLSSFYFGLLYFFKEIFHFWDYFTFLLDLIEDLDLLLIEFSDFMQVQPF